MVVACTVWLADRHLRLAGVLFEGQSDIYQRLLSKSAQAFFEVKRVI